MENFESNDENQSEGIIITDVDGVILNVNIPFTKITGFSRDEAIGSTPKILKSGKHSNEFYKSMWNSILNDGLWHGHIWNKKKNGQIYLECLTITAIKGTMETQYYLATLQDVSNCASDIDTCCSENNNRTPIIKKKFNEQDMIHAIHHEEFTLDYQPLLHISTKKLYGIEALVRWQHPKLGLIPPKDFIPFAEKTGIIIPLGEWVLENALNEMSKMNQHRIMDFKLLVNISVKQLEESSFVDMIKYLLTKTNVRPEYIELEITESILLEPTKKILEIMSELKEMGIRFSLDDFGTNHSSLQYLRYFPFDTIKIDQTFIHDIDKDIINSTIVEGIIYIGKKLGINIVAEGVESTEQIIYLREKTCDIIQGYLYSKPLPSKELSQFMHNKHNIKDIL